MLSPEVQDPSTLVRHRTMFLLHWPRSAPGPPEQGGGGACLNRGGRALTRGVTGGLISASQTTVVSENYAVNHIHMFKFRRLFVLNFFQKSIFAVGVLKTLLANKPLRGSLALTAQRAFHQALHTDRKCDFVWYTLLALCSQIQV